MSVSLAGPCTVLLSFSPPSSSQPWTCTRCGGSSPAASSIAGQYTQWNRMISLPMRWCTAGHHGVEALVVGAVADGGGVVDERVVPDVEDVAFGPRHRHAPGERRAGDRHVVEALADEAEHLVALALRRDDLGVVLDPVEQALLVAAQPEEVVLLLELGDRLAVDRAVDAVDQLGLGVVRLAGHAVRALVGVELDVAVVLDPREQRLHRGVVARLGGADEVVVGDVEAVPGLAEPGRVAVGLLLGRDARPPRPTGRP